ncbi:MAG TPA: hypothetical protein VGR89_00445 [Puia sp.]|nr:hypothetical protein [Puia sp.]
MDEPLTIIPVGGKPHFIPVAATCINYCINHWEEFSASLPSFGPYYTPDQAMIAVVEAAAFFGHATDELHEIINTHKNEENTHEH